MTFEEQLSTIIDMLHPAIVQGRYRERDMLFDMLRKLIEEHEAR